MNSNSYEPRHNVIHRSLNEPKLIKGVPKMPFVMNATMGAAVAVGLGMPQILLMSFPIHFYLKHLCRDDKIKDKVMMHRFRQADYYDPGARSTQKRNPRPLGFGTNKV